MRDNFTTTILIPGTWKDKKDIIVAFASRKKYLFLGFLLMDIETKTKFTAGFRQDWSSEEYETEFASLFPNQPKEQASLSINSVFIIEAGTGCLEQLNELCDAISEVLQTGGYGVRIVNSGKVISRKAWEELSFSNQTLFELFVSVYSKDKGILTCGMSNFGKRDIFVPLTPDDEGINFPLSYACYVVNEQPEIKEGETFSLAKNEPVFKIFEMEDELREPEHPYYNPYGLWRVWPQEWLDT